MKNKLIIILGILILGGCEQKERLINVSLINLLANPNDFIGQNVIVTGYFSSGRFGTVAIFVNKDDAENGNFGSSISLWDFPLNLYNNEKFTCKNQYVTVVGKFDYEKESGFPSVVVTEEIYLPVVLIMRGSPETSKPISGNCHYEKNGSFG
ncbi:MAG: hypothetical protein COB54_06100 [Alphaproteobacteria bacterium]|nr:MAG: hypothetical protein COB54_06100 [Alphaproteobacteria bacterium]